MACQALLGARPDSVLRPALINGAAGVVITARGRPIALMGFTVTGSTIAEIDVMADPAGSAPSPPPSSARSRLLVAWELGRRR